MKNIKSIIALTFLLSSYVVNAQTISQDIKDAQKVKNELYSLDERVNMQMWFHEQVKPMKLTIEKDSEYFSVLVNYASKIMRLDDKDKENSMEDIKSKYNKLIKKQNKEVKKVLNKEQYEIHLKIYDDLGRSILNKLNKKTE